MGYIDTDIVIKGWSGNLGTISYARYKFTIFSPRSIVLTIFLEVSFFFGVMKRVSRRYGSG